MKRSVHQEEATPAARERIGAFMYEIEKLCAKHEISISHEDEHGAFILEPYDKNSGIGGAFVDTRLAGLA